MEKGSGELRILSKLRPPLCRPLKHSMMDSRKRIAGRESSHVPVPRNAIRRKCRPSQEPSGDSRKSPDSCESANRFARIGPSKLVGVGSILGRILEIRFLPAPFCRLPFLHVSYSDATIPNVNSPAWPKLHRKLL